MIHHIQGSLIYMNLEWDFKGFRNSASTSDLQLETFLEASPLYQEVDTQSQWPHSPTESRQWAKETALEGIVGSGEHLPRRKLLRPHWGGDELSKIISRITSERLYIGWKSVETGRVNRTTTHTTTGRLQKRVHQLLNITYLLKNLGFLWHSLQFYS